MAGVRLVSGWCPAALGLAISRGSGAKNENTGFYNIKRAQPDTSEISATANLHRYVRLRGSCPAESWRETIIIY